MRGFVFTIDMLYGALAALLLLSLFSQAFQHPPISKYTLLQIQAKDKVIEWFYTSPTTVSLPQCEQPNPPAPPICPDKAFSCDFGFRPKVTTTFLDPTLSSSWVYQVQCAVEP